MSGCAHIICCCNGCIPLRCSVGSITQIDVSFKDIERCLCAMPGGPGAGSLVMTDDPNISATLQPGIDQTYRGTDYLQVRKQVGIKYKITTGDNCTGSITEFPLMVLVSITGTHLTAWLIHKDTNSAVDPSGADVFMGSSDLCTLTTVQNDFVSCVIESELMPIGRGGTATVSIKCAVNCEDNIRGGEGSDAPWHPMKIAVQLEGFGARDGTWNTSFFSDDPVWIVQSIGFFEIDLYATGLGGEVAVFDGVAGQIFSGTFDCLRIGAVAQNSPADGRTVKVVGTNW